MIGLDTNILIRYITQDDKTQAKIASAFIEKNCTIDAPGYISQIVVCEIVWVLKRAYGYDKKIVIDVIERLLKTGELIVENSENIRMALRVYQTGKADFSDYLLAISNSEVGCEYTVTFDKNASDSGLFRILSNLNSA